MRSFIASCLIFCLAAAGVWGSRVYLHAQTSELSRIAEALPVTADTDGEKIGKAVCEMRRIWAEHSFVISLTVPASRTDKIERALNDVESAWLSQDAGLYLRARAELLLALEKLHEAEDFSLAGLV